MTTAQPDIAEKILTAISQREKFAERHKKLLAEIADQSGIRPVTTEQFRARVAFMYGYCPLVDLRHCAADREIVALHKTVEATADNFRGPKIQICAVCVDTNHGLVSKDDIYPCATLLAKARGYDIQP